MSCVYLQSRSFNSFLLHFTQLCIYSKKNERRKKIVSCLSLPAFKCDNINMRRKLVEENNNKKSNHKKTLLKELSFFYSLCESHSLALSDIILYLDNNNEQEIVAVKKSRRHFSIGNCLRLFIMCHILWLIAPPLSEKSKNRHRNKNNSKIHSCKWIRGKKKEMMKNCETFSFSCGVYCDLWVNSMN